MRRYLRFLAGRERTKEGNRHLGFTLAFIAGAVNAGGYLAVSQYTSHMTGVVSSIADNLALHRFDLALAGAFSLIAFLCGAATSALLINWARRKKLHSEFALALLFEAVLLLGFGLKGANLGSFTQSSVTMTVTMLCYLMGLQNAIITKLSSAEIRTTHMTGNITDLGIELGKLLYWNLDETTGDRVLANREKLKIHAFLILQFLLGGIAGAVGFKRLGSLATVPPALLLLLIAALPVLDDLSAPPNP